MILVFYISIWKLSLDYKVIDRNVCTVVSRMALVSRQTLIVGEFIIMASIMFRFSVTRRTYRCDCRCELNWESQNKTKPRIDGIEISNLFSSQSFDDNETQHQSDFDGLESCSVYKNYSLFRLSLPEKEMNFRGQQFKKGHQSQAGFLHERDPLSANSSYPETNTLLLCFM